MDNFFARNTKGERIDKMFLQGKAIFGVDQLMVQLYSQAYSLNYTSGIFLSLVILGVSKIKV